MNFSVHKCNDTDPTKVDGGHSLWIQIKIKGRGWGVSFWVLGTAEILILQLWDKLSSIQILPNSIILVAFLSVALEQGNQFKH